MAVRVVTDSTAIDGELHPIEKACTRSKAIQRLHEIALERAPLINAAVCHSTNSEEAEILREHLVSVCHGSVVLSRFGPVDGTHVGPGSLGMALQLQ